jgi:transcriptional regulator with XRE-family HTH domain
MTPEVLKSRRESLGLTQDELAERLGVPTDTLSDWERGDGRPDAQGMLELAMDQLDLLCAMDLDPLIGQIELRMDALKALRNELARMDRTAKKAKKGGK